MKPGDARVSGGPALVAGPIGLHRMTRTRHGRVRCPTVVRIGWPDRPACVSSATHCRTGRCRRRSSGRAHSAGVRLRKSGAGQGHQRGSQNEVSHCSSPHRVSILAITAYRRQSHPASSAGVSHVIVRWRDLAVAWRLAGRNLLRAGPSVGGHCLYPAWKYLLYQRLRV